MKPSGTWCRKLACSSTPGPKPETRRQVAPDEVFLTINGERHYLWQAVDRRAMCSISWRKRRTSTPPRRSSVATPGVDPRAPVIITISSKATEQRTGEPPESGTSPASLSNNRAENSRRGAPCSPLRVLLEIARRPQMRSRGEHQEATFAPAQSEPTPSRPPVAPDEMSTNK